MAQMYIKWLKQSVDNAIWVKSWDPDIEYPKVPTLPRERSSGNVSKNNIKKLSLTSEQN